MKKTLKIIISLIVAFAVYMIFSTVNAASANLNVSSTQVEVGNTVNVSVGVNAAAWEIHLTGCVNGNYSDTSSDGNNTSFNTPTLSFTPTSAGTYKVSLRGNVTDESSNNGKATPIGDERTITVTEKATPQPAEPSQPAQPATKDPTFASTNKTMYTANDCNLRASWSTSSAATFVKAGTEVTVTGTSSEKVNGYVWNRISYNGQTKYVANFLLTATKPAEEDKDKEDEDKKDEKSTNKALKDLVVENYKLTPDFDPETTKYTVDVTKEVEKLEITPILQDDKSKFEITGNENFKVGNNIVKITVTAEDGTNRIYTITVSKSNKDGDEDATENGLKLSKLQIKDVKLDPEFKPETTNYSVVVSDPSSIKISDITAIAEDEDVEVTIAEAEADKNGNRVITIMLEDKDGSKSGVYQITIKKGIINPITELQNNKNKKIYFLLGGIIAILVIAIIVVIILLKKTSNKDDFQDIKEADELSDDYDYSLKNAIDTANSEETPEYDEMVEDSNVKSQILTNPTDYNVFEDSDNEVGVSDETKRYNMDDDEDFKPKGKKKGKHF